MENLNSVRLTAMEKLMERAMPQQLRIMQTCILEARDALIKEDREFADALLLKLEQKIADQVVQVEPLSKISCDLESQTTAMLTINQPMEELCFG